MPENQSIALVALRPRHRSKPSSLQACRLVDGQGDLVDDLQLGNWNLSVGKLESKMPKTGHWFRCSSTPLYTHGYSAMKGK